jgi:C_GCAxxG_C_C family probable redox protein
MSIRELELFAKKLMEREKFSCSEAVLLALAEYWGIKSPLIPRIATPFRGGLCGTQQVCGAVTGGLMALGMKMGRESGAESSDACIEKGKAFMKAIQAGYGSLVCLDITGLDRADPAQEERFHGADRIDLCVGLAARCCVWLAENID